MTRYLALVALLSLSFTVLGCSGNEVGSPVEVDYNKDCGLCGGSGRIAGSCAVCNGDGHRTSGVFGGNAIMCSACGGTGTSAIVCSSCGGTGRPRISNE